MSAGQHLNSFGVYIRGPRLDAELRDAARAAAREAGCTGLSQATIAFWELLAGDGGRALAELRLWGAIADITKRGTR